MHKTLLFEQIGNTRWNSLEIPETDLYPWDPKSTYIKNPPFFENMVSCGHKALIICVDDGSGIIGENM